MMRKMVLTRKTTWLVAVVTIVIIISSFCLESSCSFGLSPRFTHTTTTAAVATSRGGAKNKPSVGAPFLVGHYYNHRLPKDDPRHHHYHFTRLAFSTESSSPSSIRNDDEDNNEQQQLQQQQQREQDLQEIFQAEKRAEGGNGNDYNSYQKKEEMQQSLYQRGDLPDLNPFKKQVQKNTNNGKGKYDTLSKSLSFPDYDNNNNNNNNNNNDMDILDGDNPGQETTAETVTNQPPQPAQAPQLPFQMQQQLDDEDNDESYDGFYLSPDIYQRSRDLLHGDGSLDMESFVSSSSSNNNNGVDGRKAILEMLLQSELASGSSSSSLSSNGIGDNDDVDDNDSDNDNWNDIWSQIQTLQSRPYNATRSEELHQQIFEEEDGYLQQSERFRQSLTDPTIASKATYERRSAQFLARQTKAIQTLNSNLEEFEQSILSNNKVKKRPWGGTTTNQCDRCGVKLVEDDYDISPQLWMTKRFNITQICQVCYGDLMEMTTRNFQKLQPQQESTTATATATADPVGRRREAATIKSSSNHNNNTNNRKNTNGVSSSLEPTSSSEGADQQQQSTNGDAPSSSSSPSSSEQPLSEVSSWTEVQDPDTGETFYMNEEQNDVRWEI